MTINELIMTAHADAKAKGWWDEERNTGELLMLIVSECGEALEAHRSGKRATLEAFDIDIRTFDEMYTIAKGHSLANNTFHGHVKPERNWAHSFQKHIKDTFEDELADIVIRIADYLGSIGAEASESLISNDDGLSVKYPHLVDPEGPIGEALMNLVHHICQADIVTTDDEKAAAINPLLDAMWIVSGIAFVHKINLWRHIELKLAYNRTRPHRHGKLY